jgi:hypothetical protein
MKVEYGLAGSLAAIDPDIEAINRTLRIDGMAGNIDAPHQRGPFVLSRVKPSRSMTNGDQKGMADGNWKTIPETNN